MNQLFSKFWAWYERHYTLNVTVAAILFTLQIVHLYWLSTNVVSDRLFGISFFNPPPFWEFMIILVDYTEIPALITTSLVYINEIRKKGYSIKNVLFLFFLNIQFLHIFWITDEFVVEQFSGRGETILPFWLAWVAILIDYLELPVIFETIGKALKEIKKKLS